jgi:hypothetical protein
LIDDEGYSCAFDSSIAERPATKGNAVSGDVIGGTVVGGVGALVANQIGICYCYALKYIFIKLIKKIFFFLLFHLI